MNTITEMDARAHWIKQRATDILKELGMPPGTKGWICTREAIVLVVQSPELIFVWTKQMYPLLAERNDTSQTSVERVMRNSISRTWEIGNRKAIEGMFGYASVSEQSPTNREFVSVIADAIAMEEEKAIIRQAGGGAHA